MDERINQVICINDYTLIIFYTNLRCWQFRIISPDGSVYGSKGIFYTPEAAEEVGRKWLAGED